MLWEVSAENGRDGPAGEQLHWPGQERRWLLIQILLAIELVTRLDAALRIGVVESSTQLRISAREIHHFNKVRNRKLDWDLVLARRYLHDLYVQRRGPDGETEQIKPGKSNTPALWRDPSGHECEIFPRQPKMQIDGLVRFAKTLRWPNVGQIETTLKSKLDEAEKSAGVLAALYSDPLQTMPMSGASRVHSKCTKTGQSPGANALAPPFVLLRAATSQTFGSWLSRSWLSGLVLVGPTSGHLLMRTLLENDDSAIPKLGNLAYLRGGFALGGRISGAKLALLVTSLGLRLKALTV